MVTHSTNYLFENFIQNDSQDQRQWQDRQINTADFNSDYDQFLESPEGQAWIDIEAEADLLRHGFSY